MRTPQAHLDLFLISFLILFLELAAIRWFGSTMVALAYYVLSLALGQRVGAGAGRG